MADVALPVPDVLGGGGGVTHNHPNQTESASCSLCLAAHTTTPTPSCHYARPIFEAIGLLHEEEVVAKARLSVFDLGIRGPPAV